VRHILMLEEVFHRSEEFDILHFHIDYLHFALSRRQDVPHVTTLHGRLDIPDLVRLYRKFSDVPVVSISQAQRAPLPWLNWQATIHHGAPNQLLNFHPRAGDYLAFLGRISPEKSVDQAIEIARRSGVRLRIAAKVDPVDTYYFHTEIEPLLRDPCVEWVGEITEDEKDEFLGNALALVLPLNWEEPFGLVMIEAMACGTPVVAYSRGSIPEVLQDGVTGRIVPNLEAAIEAVETIAALDRQKCRQAFEERFTAARMARDYVSVYQRLVQGQSETPLMGEVHRAG
jgi:glycosyltransferase involved in cell wall biosynthesis